MTFTDAERWWLDRMVKVIAASAGIRTDDLDDAPFIERGGTDGALRDLGDRAADLDRRTQPGAHRVTWPVVTLDDLQSDEPRRDHGRPVRLEPRPSRHYTEPDRVVARLQNIGDRRFDRRTCCTSPRRTSSRCERMRSAGDLLGARHSARYCLARALRRRLLGPAIVKADCIVSGFEPDVDLHWVLYAMQRPEVRRWADEHRHGVGRPRLGLKVIRQIPVPLPPLDEQRRIVDLLEDHLSRLDAAQAR